MTKNPDAIDTRWRDLLDDALQCRKSFLDKAREAEKYYRCELNKEKNAHLHLMWSDTQILIPTLLSRVPKPEIRRKRNTSDPVGVLSCIINEQVVYNQVDGWSFPSELRHAVLNYIYAGLGQLWCQYYPTFDEQGLITFEKITPEFVSFQDFLLEPVRRWEECTWVGRRLLITPKVAKERGWEVDYDATSKGEKGDKYSQKRDRACVWEIWSRDTRERLFMQESGKILEKGEFPFQVEGDFPCPKPLFGTYTPSDIYPIPDREYVKEQQAEIDALTQGGFSLMQVLGVKGAYNASVSQLADIVTFKGNKLVPVRDWEGLQETGGLKSAVEFFPMEEITKTLNNTLEARERVKADYREITGMADIIRGNSSPYETASAQQEKSNFAVLRIADRQKDVQRFIADTYRIVADMAFDLFSDETIASIVDADIVQHPNFAEALQLLRDDKSRGYILEIESEATLAINMSKERAETTEFTNAVGQFLGQVLPIARDMPEFAQVLGEILKNIFRKYSGGRKQELAIEGSVEAFMQALQQKAQQPPPPDPATMKAQNDMQLGQMKLQQQAQESQAKMAIKNNEIKAQQRLQEMQFMKDARLETMRANNDMQLERMDAENQLKMGRIEMLKKVAEIRKSTAELSSYSNEAKPQSTIPTESTETGGLG